MSPNPPLVVNPVPGRAADAQAHPPLPSRGAQRWVWHSRFGSMLIEVVDDQVFVNGQRVQPHAG